MKNLEHPENTSYIRLNTGELFYTFPQVYHTDPYTSMFAIAPLDETKIHINYVYSKTLGSSSGLIFFF